MSRISLVCIGIVMIVPVPQARVAQVATAGYRDQAALHAELVAMNARLAANGRSRAEVIADAQRLAIIYGELGPYARTFGQADYALNRRLAEQSFYWLAHARAQYLTDWTVTPYLMRAYGSMGGFYRDYGSFYPAGAFMSYGGASRLARFLYLGSADRVAIEHDMQRYALAYATAACAANTCFDWWTQPEQQEPTERQPARPLPTPQLVRLPAIDVAGLTSAQRAQWTDLQDRFRPIAARVLEARIRMDDLAARLAQRRMQVNATDVANAASMQGFLDDAVELAASHQFQLAAEAAMRADYVRSRLRNVIGQ